MEFTTSADGTRIAFERQGSGEPILLVHGTTASAQSWALVVPFLADRFTVVAMDRRGHGESEPGASHSLDVEAEDVIAVVEAVGEPVHLVGHSGGAARPSPRRRARTACGHSSCMSRRLRFSTVQRTPPTTPTR